MFPEVTLYEFTATIAIRPRAECQVRPASIEILGCSVSRVTIDEALNRIERWIELREERCRFVVATGFHGIWEAHRDPRLRDVLNAADLFCPDGIAPVSIWQLQVIHLYQCNLPGLDSWRASRH